MTLSSTKSSPSSTTFSPEATVDLGNDWHVSGIVEQGKLSRTFADIASLQRQFGGIGLVSTIYVKLDDPANTSRRHGGSEEGS